jgi:hypothetical protein
MRTPSHPPNLSHSGLTDLLAARALLGAMEPDWKPEAAACVLARLAAGHDDALRRALAQIQLRSLEGSTPVAERAASALRLASGSWPGAERFSE